MKITVLRFVFVLSALILTFEAKNKTAFAQNISDETFTALSDASGEETIVQLEMIVRDYKQSNERIFVIAHSGKGETSSIISSYRMKIARWKLSTMGVDLQKIVIAEGERVKEEGQIDFYLGSRLRLITLAKRNKMPNLTCCEDYIPPVKNNPRRRKRKN